MLGSSSHNHQEENEDLQVEVDPPPPQPPPPPPPPPHFRSSTSFHYQPEIENRHLPPSIHMRQLLLTAAQLISRSDLTAAHRLISILSSNSSAYGDSTDRLVHTFTKALSFRLHRHPPPPPPLPIFLNFTPPPTTTTTITTTTQRYNNYSDQDCDPILQSSYLSLNQITPFIRFSQLTANQAILEAIDQS